MSTAPARIPALPAPRTVLGLLGAYLVVSWVTVALVAVFSATSPGLVTPQAWVRTIIVAATSVLTFVFGLRAARRRPRALLRLRIATSIIFVAIVGVIFFLPLPLWVLLEQILCGVLLLLVVILVFRSSAAEPSADARPDETA